MEDETGQYAAAANAILGHPLNMNQPGPPIPDRTPMISIAATSEAAERDKIVSILSVWTVAFSQWKTLSSSRFLAKVLLERSFSARKSAPRSYMP